MASATSQVQAVIQNGQALSQVIDLQGYRVTGIIMPAVWTAANITFASAASPVGAGVGQSMVPATAAFQPVFNDAGTEVSVTAVVGHNVTFTSTGLLEGLRFLQVRSGTFSVPVNQGQLTTLTLVLRPETT